MVHLVPVRAQVTSKEVARMFYYVIFRHHGLPEAIISDRDPRFTASFWRELFSLLGTRLVMSTADHPQTDGQTERVNRVLGDILRSYCVKNDKDWSSFLPSVEFAINSSVHVSTGYTPFYLNSFRNPKTPLMTTDISSLSRGGNRNAFDSSHHDMGVEKVSTIVKQFIDRRISIISSVRDKLAEVKDYQKEQADKKGRKNFISFNVNDLVLLSTKSLPKNSISNIGSNKLLPRYIGPFKVLKKINNTAYKLDIPSRMKIHPVFYVGRLKEYNRDDSITDQTSSSSFPQQELVGHEDMAKDNSEVQTALEHFQPQTKVYSSSEKSLTRFPSASPYKQQLDQSRNESDLDSSSRVRSHSKHSSRKIPCETVKTLHRPKDVGTLRPPPPVVGSDGTERYIVECLLDSRHRNSHVSYLMHWLGYSHDFDTWETRESLLEDVPDLVRDFENSN